MPRHHGDPLTTERLPGLVISLLPEGRELLRCDTDFKQVLKWTGSKIRDPAVGRWTWPIIVAMCSSAWPPTSGYPGQRPCPPDRHKPCPGPLRIPELPLLLAV